MVIQRLECCDEFDHDKINHDDKLQQLSNHCELTQLQLCN